MPIALREATPADRSLAASMSPRLHVRTRRPGFSGATAADRYGSPAAGVFYGCQDINYTSAYPLTLRVMATLYLD